MTDPLAATDSLIDNILSTRPYELPQKEKNAGITAALAELTEYHRQKCTPYAGILDAYGYTGPENPGRIGFIPARLFKELSLCSVDEDEIFKVLTSSGTTSQKPSRIFLDRTTAQLQTKALVKIMQSFLGTKRMPMLIVDRPDIVTNRNSFSARGAGILGLQTFGHSHVYLLDTENRIDLNVLNSFVAKFSGEPALIFGFTFMIWQYVICALEAANKTIDLTNAVLVHSGGWKKLQEQAVDNNTFKARLKKATGITHVHSFYGMVEQVGSVFVECENGVLHAPGFADVLIRDPMDWSLCSAKKEGLIEVLSILPRSYPGHRILTEDRGRLLGEDDCPCGRKGRYFEVFGRLAGAEIRGCSDSYVSEISRRAN